MTTDQLQQIVDFVHETGKMLVERDGDAVDPAIIYNNPNHSPRHCERP